MKQLDRKYYNLKPHSEYLSDQYILGLAWKKADGFVRNYNWYSNLLSLDKVTFNIQNEIINWSNSIKRGTYKGRDLNLIPAPKATKWSISGSKWALEEDDIELRPLADIYIKDQTVSTAVLMCVADALESRQKNCSLAEQSYSDHMKNEMVSYGNRLLCDWERGVARFRWGGSEFYRKYSTDYRAFLQRSVHTGRETQKKVGMASEVYVVHIDLKNFFDSIKVDLLFDKLESVVRSHYEEYHNSIYSSDLGFWRKARSFFLWHWSEESKNIATELDMILPIGLPQGLASSGALSNAYLLDFDEIVVGKLQKRIGDEKLYLHDYCRYVDDLRFVVSAELQTKADIQNIVEKFVQSLLDISLDRSVDDLQYLDVNCGKTKVFDLGDLDHDSSLSNRVNELQSEIGASCVAERNTLEASIPALQHLLESNQEGTQGAEQLFPSIGIDSAIKMDSLRRFSAYRLSSTLKQKSLLIPPKDMFFLENEAKVISKKLITVWLKDPSNMVVFRNAIEISPISELYCSIINEVHRRVNARRADKKDRYIMIYILSDIFRSVIDIIASLSGARKVEYKRLINDTTAIAQKILHSDKSLPSYLYEQAQFYLITVNQPFLDSGKASRYIEKFHQVLMKKELQDFKSSDGYLFELTAQITSDYQTSAAFLLSDSLKPNVRKSILKAYAFKGGEFWCAIWNELRRTKKKKLLNMFRWAAPKEEQSPVSKVHHLSTVLNFRINPFMYEHALLKLGIALVDLLKQNENEVWRSNGEQLSPNEIKVEIHGAHTWHDLWKADCKISCMPEPKSENLFDPRFETPRWLISDTYTLEDEKKIYWICSLLRSAALGSVDFTQRNDLKESRKGYLGIKTQWFKRRMGMLHSPESIVGSFGTISDWFAHLLQHCLQWPGFSSSYIEEEEMLQITNIDDFQACLKNRLQLLNSKICISSKIPTIPTIVNRPNLQSNLFRVVTIQQLLPREEHFHPADVTLSDPSIRWKHREHLAEICKLTEQTLDAKLKTLSQNFNSSADLIVFSEVAVHPDDEDLIRNLALKTKAIIFAGFVFTEEDGRVINKSRWIIPDKAEFGMQWRVRDQGKHHMTPGEKSLGVSGYRPCQHIIEIEGCTEGPFKLTGAICYDATDICLAADLRDKTDMFVIAAHNKDVNTFDNMASALQWHMYQHIVITNTGEYGGSTIQAPYKEKHHKLISHAHGSNQIAISTADIDLAAFRRKVKEYKKTKAEPAGFNRKH